MDGKEREAVEEKSWKMRKEFIFGARLRLLKLESGLRSYRAAVPTADSRWSCADPAVLRPEVVCD